MPSSANACACVARTRSRGPPIASQTVSTDRPMPRAVSSAASFGGRRIVPGERQDPGAGRELRNDRLERTAMQRQERAVLLAPAEARGGEREGRGRGQAIISSAAKRRIKHRPDAEEERIAARQHADGLAAPGLDPVERVLDRRRPDQVSAVKRPGEREMAPAADDERRLREEPPRGRREAVEPVLAEPDDRKPTLPAHGAAP